MSFVNVFEDVAGMMYMDTHLKGVLGFRGVIDLYFIYLLWRYDMMCKKGQDLI